MPVQGRPLNILIVITVNNKPKLTQKRRSPVLEMVLILKISPSINRHSVVKRKESVISFKWKMVTKSIKSMHKNKTINAFFSEMDFRYSTDFDMDWDGLNASLLTDFNDNKGASKDTASVFNTRNIPMSMEESRIGNNRLKSFSMIELWICNGDRQITPHQIAT